MVSDFQPAVFGGCYFYTLPIQVRALVKEVTGAEPFRSAPKYGNSTESFPVWHFFLSTNHKPKISGQDEGTWRRILYLKFDYTVPKDRRRPLDEFTNYLCEELPEFLIGHCSDRSTKSDRFAGDKRICWRGKRSYSVGNDIGENDEVNEREIW